VRRATPHDIDIVNRLMVDAFDRTIPASDLAAPELFVSLTDCDQAMGAIYFARDAGRWCGHATSLAVHTDARGQGLSRLVIDDWRRIATDFAAAHGPMRVFGYSNPTRQATAHLLTTAGWTHLAHPDGPGGTHLWALDL
jgi:GNAT superfamily N-acetyltransferase